MTNSVKDIVPKLVMSFDICVYRIFVYGNYNTCITSYDCDTFIKVKEEITSLGLYIDLLSPIIIGDNKSEWFSIYKFELNNKSVYIKFSELYDSSYGTTFIAWVFVDKNYYNNLK